MSASRWNYDRLNAQTAFNLVADWPGYRCKTSKCNTILNGWQQVRGQAWFLRVLAQNVFVARTGSSEAVEWTETLKDNWAYVQTH